MRLLLQVPFVRKNLVRWLRWLNPFSDRDLLERYANFLDISYLNSQREIFELLRGYYPLNTVFVVLPMDMDYMGAGKMPQPYEEQLAELEELCNSADYGEQIIPFIAIDPRRPGFMDLLTHWVEEHNFRGIKLYPNLGYYPSSPALAPLWQYAESRQLPIISHCSPGGIFQKHLPNPQERINPLTGSLLASTSPRQFARHFADPDQYVPVLEKHPYLKLCLAHFGGDEEWLRYYQQPWLGVSGNRKAGIASERSWFNKIVDLLRSEKYPNLYTDIAYTVFNLTDNMPLLKVILNDPLVRERVLFGSDYYMVEQERFEERRLSILLRSVVEEDLFGKIANENPRRFLGL
jgi:predicted TIM-barrel fold metal-dependent hydrolase